MQLKVKFHPVAKQEYLDGLRWYKNHSSQLGGRFALAVKNCLEKIDRYPTAFPQVFETQRQASVAGFPYILLYEFNDDEIWLVAIFHTRRDPRNKLR